MPARTFLIVGGLASSAILVIFGIACIVIGMQGRQEVRDQLAAENIIGTPDSDIPGELVDTGEKAKAFAEVMRAHALAATGGLTYSELPRYVTEDGEPTDDPEEAAQMPNGQPEENPLRQLWITETALSTALNTAFFAEQVGNFAIVMGIALLLTGIGFAVLTFGALWRHDQLLSELEEWRSGRTPSASR